MERIQDLSNLVSSFNPPRYGRPPLHFTPPSTEQVQNLLSNPIQNPPTIDLTTPNPRNDTTLCQAPHHPQNTNLKILHLPQNQNTNNAQTFPHNYQATANTQSPSIAPPIPQKTIFQIPISNEPYVNCSELDHYNEHESEWRSKEEEVKLNMKEEIRKAMKELHYISEVHRLSYKDLCIHPNLNLSEGSKVTKFVTFDGNPLEH